MEEFIEKLRGLMETARSSPGVLEFSVLGLGALLEYIFPPFPGDAIVLLGAFCVGHYGWSLPLVWIVVSVGSAIGLSLDYALGVWVGRRDAAWRKKYPLWGRMGASIDRFDRFYRRWGVWCIGANRFVPAVRAAFFVAAGLAGIKYWKVLVLGLVSATVWNLLLLLVGVSVGHNWKRLRGFLDTYSTAAWITVGLVVCAALVGYLVIRRKPQAPS